MKLGAMGTSLAKERTAEGMSPEAILDVLEHGGEHPLNARSARHVHEILMAIYESARRRARIDLPLTVAESPLEAMVAVGEA